MKTIFRSALFFIAIGFTCCQQELYLTNGETIYRTGTNKRGVAVLDKKGSQITVFKSCQGCHGKNGTRMAKCDIRYSSLTSNSIHSTPYDDALIVRFLDKDLKSDGSVARTGVKWKLSDEDKRDLIEFLKTL